MAGYGVKQQILERLSPLHLRSDTGLIFFLIYDILLILLIMLYCSHLPEKSMPLERELN